MDIQTKDGILLRGIPDGTPDDAIKARIEKIRAEGQSEGGTIPHPALMAAQGVTRLGGLSKSPFSAPDIEGMGYKLGGAVTDTASSAGASPEVSAGAGYLANLAGQALPAVAGGWIGSKAGNIGKKVGETLMRMAVKPSTTLSPASSANAVKTMLTADVGNILPGANVTSGGIRQIQGKIGSLGDEVKGILSQAPGTANKYQIAKNALREASDKYSPAVNAAPSSDLQSINNVIVDYLRTHPTQSTAGEAHALKQGIYKVLGDKAYKGDAMKSAEVATQKAIARALRGETERLAPEIAPLNAQQSELINAVKAAISRNAVSGNKDPMGLASLVVSDPRAALSFMANRSELVKSVLARLLHSGSGVTGTATGAGIGASYASQEGE